jgi:hypothetical protein
MLLFHHNIHEKMTICLVKWLVLDTVFVPGLLGVFFFVRQGAGGGVSYPHRSHSKNDVVPSSALLICNE